MNHLAQEIINGRRLTSADDLSFLLSEDLEELCQDANAIRQALCGNRIDLCTITNGRGGRCSENCKFCAQSAHHHTDCSVHEFLNQDELMKQCDHAFSCGIDRYSIVTAGRTLEGSDLEKALDAYSAMHQKYPDMILCASHGLMRAEDLKRLKEAGVTMYHANVETSRRYFPTICTTHTYEDKLEEIRMAKEAGLIVCCGGIMGMGENWQDRLDMALLLSELEISSIPLNFLIPIAGTPLGSLPALQPEEILRCTAIFRYLNPTAYIRIAAGRNYFPDGGKELFLAGANAALTGDMLTTVGNNTAQDRTMLAGLGFQLKAVP